MLRSNLRNGNYMEVKGKFTERTAMAIVIANMIGTGIFTSLGFQLADIRSGFVIMSLWVLGGGRARTAGVHDRGGAAGAAVCVRADGVAPGGGKLDPGERGVAWRGGEGGVETRGVFAEVSEDSRAVARP